MFSANPEILMGIAENKGGRYEERLKMIEEIEKR